MGCGYIGGGDGGAGRAWPRGGSEAGGGAEVIESGSAEPAAADPAAGATEHAESWMSAGERLPR